MAIHRFDPFRDVLALQNRVQGILQDHARREHGDQSATASFAPPVDIYEDASQIVLTLEAPGLTQDGFDIQLENNTLSIRGERSFQDKAKQENYHRIERRYGSFRRAFTLPQSVNAETVAATYEAGVLRITVDKRVEAKPRQIKVSVGTASAPKIESAGNQPAA